MLDLSEFRNMEGQSVEDMVNEVLADAGIEIESYLPAISG
jgi:hypothetical protein